MMVDCSLEGCMMVDCSLEGCMMVDCSLEGEEAYSSLGVVEAYSSLEVDCS
jgi:hypothetical protein